MTQAKKSEATVCTHGKGFCPVHQADCEVHYWMMGDGRCSCQECPPKSKKHIAEQFELPIPVIGNQITWDEVHKHVMDITNTPINSELCIPMDLKCGSDDSRIAPEYFYVRDISIFDTPADAYVNSINCVGVMGAGIALEFKRRYPAMYNDYQMQCKRRGIRPGDCYVYFDTEHDVYLLGMAVKDNWKYWSTREWVESSIKSLKLALLENDIKSVNLPAIGGENGRRGPHGKITGMTIPPKKDEVITLLEQELKPFANKFQININVCVPSENKHQKKQLTLDQFLED